MVSASKAKQAEERRRIHVLQANDSLGFCQEPFLSLWGETDSKMLGINGALSDADKCCKMWSTAWSLCMRIAFGMAALICSSRTLNGALIPLLQACQPPRAYLKPKNCTHELCSSQTARTLSWGIPYEEHKSRTKDGKKPRESIRYKRPSLRFHHSRRLCLSLKKDFSAGTWSRAPTNSVTNPHPKFRVSPRSSGTISPLKGVMTIFHK